MNVERINPGCCTFGHNYVYVFGGRGADPKADFYDSIERLNTDLNLWSFVKIRLPSKLCNLYAFPVKNDFILILGGLKKVTLEPVNEISGSSEQREEIKNKNAQSLQREQHVDRNVYLYCQSKQVWYNLKPLSNKMKVCNVILSGDCRFNCFLLSPPPQTLPGQPIQKAQAPQFPLNIIYDLKVVCPRLDRYWYFDHLEKANTLKHAQESESKSFLRSVGKSQIDQPKPKNDQTSAKSLQRRGTNKNFEWERKVSNYDPKEFGEELPRMPQKSNYVEEYPVEPEPDKKQTQKLA